MPVTSSLRSYAKHRGVSVEAVSKAVTTGRLRASVTIVDGAPKIADVELADQEWAANTRSRADHPSSPSPKKAERVSIEVAPDYHESRALRESHAARREAALADLAEIDLGERRAELVPADDARSYMINKFTVVKTRMLGVPSLMAQRLPDLAEQIVPVLESLVREVLEELAIDDDDDGELEA
jgi:hypothetical protein